MDLSIHRPKISIASLLRTSCDSFSRNNKNILNAVELAGIFHFPDQNSIPTTQLERQASKQVDGPRNIPDEGLLLGYNVFRGQRRR